MESVSKTTACHDLGPVLATAQASQRVPLHGQQGPSTPLLQVTLRVQREQGSRHGSRLSYHGEVSLEGHGEIGYVHAWVLSKAPDARAGPKQKAPWVREWLQGAACYYSERTTRPMMTALRALYTGVGAPRKAATSGMAEEEAWLRGEQLREDVLVYIEKIYISCEFSGRGLLKRALNLFYGALAHEALTEEHRLQGHITLLLEPGMPEDEEESKCWTGGMAVEEVDDDTLERAERALMDIYSRPSIGFEVYVDAFPLNAEYHTIMGRRLDLSSVGSVNGSTTPPSGASSTSSPASSKTSKTLDGETPEGTLD